ncbi:MAG: hypothetical protein IAF94_26065 [Pirellulaceae bacterium]|nr:hypothetical protein [Pirellulaceae bacterium]
MPANPYQSPDAEVPPPPRRFSWLPLIIVVVVVALLLLVPIGLGVGLIAMIIAEGRAYHEQYLQEKAVIVPILASDPAFKDLEEHEYSGGGAYITGRVDRQEDMENLRDRLAAPLGEHRADDLVRGVYTREQEKEWNEETTSPPPPAPHP